MNALFAALVNGAIASGLTAGTISLVLRFASRDALNAATRYAIWWAAMAITLALPVFFLPAHVSPPIPDLSRRQLADSSAIGSAGITYLRREYSTGSSSTGQKGDRPEVSQVRRNSRAVPVLHFLLPAVGWMPWIFVA